MRQILITHAGEPVAKRVYEALNAPGAAQVVAGLGEEPCILVGKDPTVFARATEVLQETRNLPGLYQLDPELSMYTNFLSAIGVADEPDADGVDPFKPLDVFRERLKGIF